MTKLPIHVALCVNDGYVPYICVTIKSVIENNKGEDLHVHVLSDYISDDKKRLLDEVVKDCNDVSLHVNIVDDSKLRGLKDTWSIYTWYRVLLPEVLPLDVHRVLYLDADTVVDGSIKELFEIDMTDKASAGCIDPESFNDETFTRCGYDRQLKYICAGVMLMNLDYWRENDLTRRVVEWGFENNDRIKFPDQDTINYLCRENKIVLPLRFGVIGGYYYMDVMYTDEYLDQLKECLTNPVIIHYAGQAPWKIELSNHLQQDIWEKYNNMLAHPAKRDYITKGWKRVKMFVWNMFHPNRNKSLIERNNNIRKRLLG